MLSIRVHKVTLLIFCLLEGLLYAGHFGEEHVHDGLASHPRTSSSPPVRSNRKSLHRNNRPHRRDRSPSCQSPVKPHDHYLGLRATWSCIGKNAFGSRVVDEPEKTPHGQATQQHRHSRHGVGGSERRDGGAIGKARGEEKRRLRREGGSVLSGGLVEEEEVKNAITELRKRLSEIRATNSGAPSSSISSTAPARHTNLDRPAPRQTTRLDRCGPGQPDLPNASNCDGNKIVSNQIVGAESSKRLGAGKDSAPRSQAARPVQNLQSFVEELEEGMET